MNMMILGAGTPSACERSRTVTPDGTVIGPVGATTSRGVLGRDASRSRCCCRASRGRAAALSITTRRLRREPAPPCRGRMGRFGLFELDSLAIRCSSVEGCQFLIDPDGLPQRAVERAARDGPLEAWKPAAGIGPATGHACARNKPTVHRREAQKLPLRSFPPAADAASDRLGHAAGG